MAVATLVVAFPLLSNEVSAQNEFGAADEAGIRENLSTYLSTDPIAEPNLFFSQFTDDVHWIFDGQDPWVGMDQLRAVTWCHTEEAAIIADRIEGTADLAYARGTYSLELDCEDGPLASAGSFLSVHRRGDDGVWRIEALHQFGDGSG
jgi:ketosteroid isomerase-like protein